MNILSLYHQTHHCRVYTITLILLLGGGIATGASFVSAPAKGEDIYYIYLEGKRINRFENPYSRARDSDMRTNEKYATYLPLYYYQSALIQQLGLREFTSWLIAWRVFNLSIYVLLGWLVFHLVFVELGLLAAIFSTLFWQFHAFTLTVLSTANTDFLPIALLVLSLHLLDKNIRVSLLLFSISLSLKHIGILLLPIFILYLYPQRNSFKQTIILSLAYICSIPFLLSLPFLLWDPVSFFKSIGISVTRDASSHFEITTIDSFLHMGGFVSRLPMLLMITLIAILYHQRKTDKYFAAFLLLSVFIGFNPVLFKQYLLWPVVFIPLIFTELKTNTVNQAGELLPEDHTK